MSAQDNVREREAAVQEAAVKVTEEQVRQALEICRESLPNDNRQTNPAVLGAVIQALAINFAGLLAARK